MTSYRSPSAVSLASSASLDGGFRRRFVTGLRASAYARPSSVDFAGASWPTGIDQHTFTTSSEPVRRCCAARLATAGCSSRPRGPAPHALAHGVERAAKPAERLDPPGQPGVCVGLGARGIGSAILAATDALERHVERGAVSGRCARCSSRPRPAARGGHLSRAHALEDREDAVPPRRPPERAPVGPAARDPQRHVRLLHRARQ